MKHNLLKRTGAAVSLVAATSLGVTGCSNGNEKVPVLGRIVTAEELGRVTVSICTEHDANGSHKDNLWVTATKPDKTPDYTVRPLRARNGTLISGQRIEWGAILSSPSSGDGTRFVGFEEGEGLGAKPVVSSEDINVSVCVVKVSTSLNSPEPGDFVVVGAGGAEAYANGGG